MRFPPIDSELLAALEALFPHRSPDKSETAADLMFRGGQRQVVDFLKSKFEEQQAGSEGMPDVLRLSTRHTEN